MTNLPSVKLSKGIHVMHLFHRINRVAWNQLPAEASRSVLEKLETICAANNATSNPRVRTYTNIGGKSDIVFMLYAAELGQIGQLHRDIEQCFLPGTLRLEYSFLSVTELPEYVTTEDDMRNALIQREKLEPGSDVFEKKLAEGKARQAQYEQYRLYPEMPDWEIMAFYPMNKRRRGKENWYSLDFSIRKKLMLGHAAVGRKFSGRISQLITGATGIDDYEWGVTLMAHQTDALKEIVYEMRFDEVSARYGDFGPFYVNLRLDPKLLWEHLHL